MSPRLELMAQGVAYRCSKVECEDHSAIQAPLFSPSYGQIFITNFLSIFGKCHHLWSFGKVIFESEHG